MTFQIGLVGTDGFVIASDRKAHFAQRTRWGASTDKLSVSEENGIITAFSIDDIALNVSSDLVRLEIPMGAQTETVRALLKEASDKSWKTHIPKKRDGTPGSNTVSKVIFGCGKNSNSLWLVDVQESSVVRRIEDRCFAGDQINPAVYFAERYYAPGSGLRPINELIFVATHTVLMGAPLNNAIEGLQLAICRVGQNGEIIECRRLSDEELAPHRERAAELDKELGYKLF